jgi:hypothetical protein
MSGMTREEAVIILDGFKNNPLFNSTHIRAFDMAISALSENKGEWIKIQSGDKDFPESIVCSKCKNENSHLDFNEHGEPIGKVFVTSKFCPNCGADMRGDKAE